MSINWLSNYLEALLFPELLPPAEWRVDTLSSLDLNNKMDWCQNKLLNIRQRLPDLQDNELLLAEEFIKWLDYQIALLQHWLDTLPDAANRRDPNSA